MDVLDVLDNLPSPTSANEDTEADTRAKIIDPMIEALGWSASGVRREPYAGWDENRGYIDYLLSAEGRPRYVLEAKRSGRTFEIPASLRKQRHTSYKKLYSTGSPHLKEALDQCLRYSQHTGAPYAVATNGFDWVFFKPAHPYRDLPNARVVIFSGTQEVRDRLDEFEQIFSCEGVKQGKCEMRLLGRELRVPTFAKKLRDLYPYHHSFTLEEEEYNSLLFELIDPLMRSKMIDVTDDEDFRRCYVPVQGNFTTSATIGTAIMSRARLAGRQSKGKLFVDSVVREPRARAKGRTLILHGEMGVGKTTFLRNCEDELKRSGVLNGTVWARIDLLPFRDRPFQLSQLDAILGLISKQVHAAVVSATEQMPGNFDPQEWDHLRDIYNAEARSFQKARFPGANDSDLVYLHALRNHIWELCQKDAQEHLLRTIRWLTDKRLPVVVVLDNSDQLGLEFQEYLHKLSQSLQSRTSAVTILVIRTEALASHRIREHAIATVDEYFQIIPAPFPTILKKRFEAIHSALDEFLKSDDDEASRDVRTVASERLSALMDTIEYEATKGTEAYQIIDAAGNGSLRDALRAVAALFRSSPKDMDRMVVDEHRDGHARLRKERVLRALMKEDLRGLESHRLVPNVFITEDQVHVPYSLGFRLLQQIRSRAPIADYSVSTLLNDFAVAGVDRSLCGRVLLRLRRERMVAVPHMLPDLREEDTLSATLLGQAIADIFVRMPDYYSQMIFDVYIYESEIFNLAKETWNSTDSFYAKLSRLGFYFRDIVQKTDLNFQIGIDGSQLEPAVRESFPILLEWKNI